jgi:hypothetical protein
MLPDLRKCLQPKRDHRPMSRGHGQVQRSLLATLRRAGHLDGRRDGGDYGLDTLTLARHAYRLGGAPSHAQAVAVRRALTTLARHGLVVRLGNLGYGRECRWVIAH